MCRHLSIRLETAPPDLAIHEQSSGWLLTANVTKEIYRLAMRDGHHTQDFSAIYDYLTDNHNVTTIGQLNISFHEDRAQRTLALK
jgi:hypothetical protein